LGSPGVAGAEALRLAAGRAGGGGGQGAEEGVRGRADGLLGWGCLGERRLGDFEDLRRPRRASFLEEDCEKNPKLEP
jgi:hypothetical protein